MIGWANKISITVERAGSVKAEVTDPRPVLNRGIEPASVVYSLSPYACEVVLKCHVRLCTGTFLLCVRAEEGTVLVNFL